MKQTMSRETKYIPVHVCFKAKDPKTEMTVRDKSSITSIVNKLERGGLVTRTGDEEDRRNKRLYLSEEGERLAETFKPVIDRVYEEIHSRMGCEKGTELCIGYLNRMYEVLESM